MFMTKLKIAAAILFAVGVTGSGAGVLTYGGVAEEQAKPRAQKAATAAANEPDGKGTKLSARAGKGSELIAPDLERELALAESDYVQQERKWSKELVEARLRLMQTEDKLRNSGNEFYSSDEHDIRNRLTHSEAQLRQRERAMADKEHPRIKQSREETRRLQEQWNDITDKHAQVLADARREFVNAEEDLRLLERLQTMKREKAIRKLQAADEQVRRLQGGVSHVESAARGSLELETKVDQLLRELADLRREIRRQQTDKGQQQPAGRRPDQP